MKSNGISSASPTVLPAAERREAEQSEADRSVAAGRAVAPAPKDNRSTSNQDWINSLKNAGQIVAAAQKAEYAPVFTAGGITRSEEHTSELQSLRHLVCR